MAEAALSSRIRAYLQRKGSPLAGYSNAFVRSGRKYGIDPRFLVAISGIETGFAKAGSGLKNPFGWNSTRPYASVPGLIEEIARGLSKKGGYYDGKNTIDAIGATWAPPGASNDPRGTNGGWPSAVKQFYRELGGNPGANVKGLARGQVAVGNAGDSQALATVANRLPGGAQRLGQLQGITGSALPPEVLTGIKAYSDRARQSVLDGTFNPKDGQFEAIRNALIQNLQVRQARAQGVLASGGGELVRGTNGVARGGGRGTGGDGMLDYGGGAQVGRILPTKLGGSSYGYADPEGQGGRHLAHDWFAPANTAAASPVDGTVFRVKADPNPGKQASGQIFGGTVYIKAADGKIWVIRHMESPSVRQGQRIRRGQRIGAVKNWGKGSHLHVELYGQGPYEYSPKRAMNPFEYLSKRGIR